MAHRLLAVLKRPSTWGWLAAAAAAGGYSVSPEIRDLIGLALPVLLEVIGA